MKGMMSITVQTVVLLRCLGAFVGISTAQMGDFLAALQERKTALVERMVQVSEHFLGAPYQISPLGEGPGHPPDTDPLIRYDAFDCTTFVEETLALALSSHVAEAQDSLRRIRYINGEVGYTTRKHFVMAQWIPMNQKAGFLVDITVQVGGDHTRWARKRLDGHVWQMRWNKAMWPALRPEQVPSGIFALPIIPLEDLPGLMGRIPSGAILSVVREDRPWFPERVSHQGLVVIRKGRFFLRHASKLPFHRVVDEPLEGFLKRNLAYRKWSVEGLNLQMPRDDRSPQKSGCRTLLVPSVHDNFLG